MELISGSELRIVRRFFPDIGFPFRNEQGWYLLVDIAQEDSAAVNEALAELLAPAMEDGRIADVVVSSSEAQRAAIWKLRHSVTESHKKYGMGMSHDVAVPLARIPEFLLRAGKEVTERWPAADIAVVGHVGDGNLHYNVIWEKSLWDAIPDKPLTRREVYKAVYDLAAEMEGTFSAEHGIGALHVAEMSAYKSSVELDMMRGVRALLDPNNIMNPGRVIPS